MFTIRARVAAVTGAVALSAAAFVAVAAPAQADSGLNKVGFCHSTGSTTNPYNYQTTSWNNVLSWASGGTITNGKHVYDLIPSFTAMGFAGQTMAVPLTTIVPAQCDVASAAAAATFALGGSAYTAAGAAAAAVNAGSATAMTADPSAAISAASADATAAATTATPSTVTATPSTTTATPPIVVVYGDATSSSTGLLAQ